MVAGITDDSIVDGPGLRRTIFVQGCKHNCEQCQNPETHSFSGGNLYRVNELLDGIEENVLLDGITLSGGDPMEQALELVDLAEEVKKLGLTVWCYTGYTFEQCVSNKDRLKLLRNCDVLVDGKFDYKLKTCDHSFIGSTNQRIIDIQKSIEAGKVVEMEL